MLGLNQEAGGLDFDPVAARGAISVRVGTLRDRPSGGLKMGPFADGRLPFFGSLIRTKVLESDRRQLKNHTFKAGR